MLALILTLFDAVSVKAVLAFHATASLTFPLPDPAVAPLLLCRLTPVVPRLLESVVPVISPPLAATIKFCGSIIQLPYDPVGAAVVTLDCAAAFTRAAEVAM